MNSENTPASFFQLFAIFLKLGLTSFGGPVAHIGFFRDEFVSRRKWFTEEGYAELVSLCQFLPGPASSQVGFAIGLSRGGYMGACAAWLGFTMPSALLLIGLALGISGFNEILHDGVLHGLKLVAAAVVAQALWGMQNSLCPDWPRRSIMLLTAACLIVFPSITTQVGTIVIAGTLGWFAFGVPLFNLTASHNKTSNNIDSSLNSSLGGNLGRNLDSSLQSPSFQFPQGFATHACLVLFLFLLFALPLADYVFTHSSVQFQEPYWLGIADAFYRSGALVFGGGHVVLPLLEAEVVNSGWIQKEVFLAGYGATQAVPGPLFTFAAFLGAAMGQGVSAFIYGAISLVFVFLPSLLLLVGILPYWQRLKKNLRVKNALMMINAAVVGLLLATLYNPILTSTLDNYYDIPLILIACWALFWLKMPPWLLVLAGILIGLLGQFLF